MIWDNSNSFDDEPIYGFLLLSMILDGINIHTLNVFSTRYLVPSNSPSNGLSYHFRIVFKFTLSFSRIPNCHFMLLMKFFQNIWRTMASPSYSFVY